MSTWCSCCSSESEDGIYICSQCEEIENAEIEKLREQNKTLKEALEYYANRMGSGGTAREALAKVEK